MRRFLHNVNLRRAPYDQNRAFDAYLSEFVKQVKEQLANNDDYLLIIAGPPRRGKSHLGLHLYEEFDAEGCDVKYVAQNRTAFADSLKLVEQKVGLRFLDYDEANLNKRDALSKWNKDMMDLYFAIGGLNIFHVWCNPSVEMLDKPFIEERVKGLILVYDKNPLRRIYFFFKATSLLTILERHGNLKLRTLIKNRHLAYYQGWFREYKGKLKEPYLAQKAQSMSAKVDDFHKKWGSESKKDMSGWIAQSVMAERLGMRQASMINYERELLREGKLQEEVHVLRAPNGRKFFRDEVFELFLDKQSQKRRAKV